MKETNTQAKAEALCKAALQAAARALHTAQLASDALERAGAEYVTRCKGVGMDAAVMHNLEAEKAAVATLRDRLLDAYASVPDGARERMLASKATLTSDELIDLLALCVRG